MMLGNTRKTQKAKKIKNYRRKIEKKSRGKKEINESRRKKVLIEFKRKK